jgi:ankyrin repeat protein/cell wall assembly regulator SMI1
MHKKLYEGLLMSNLDTIKAAIAAGADVNEPSGKTPGLHLAIHMPEALALFLKLGVDPNVLDSPNKSNALSGAACKGNAEATAALIAAGTDVNNMDIIGFTPLCQAALIGKATNIEVMRLLLDAGADIEAGKGSTPLMMASRSVQAMKYLLDRGANPNATRPTQGTALHVCIDSKNIEGIKLLLSRGADPNIPGPTGLTALEYAKKKKLKKAIEVLEGGPAAAPPIAAAQPFLPAFEKLLKKKSYSWRPPATKDEIASLAEHVGKPLPPLLVEIYQRADGQKPAAKKPLCPPEDSLDAGWYLTPISEVIADAKMLTELLDQGEFADSAKEVVADSGVQKAWWNRHWLPILGDGGGDYVCIDFNPAKSGNVGQVIGFRHDSGERNLLGVGLEAYLTELELG